jgi:hypothetical protein
MTEPEKVDLNKLRHEVGGLRQDFKNFSILNLKKEEQIEEYNKKLDRVLTLILGDESQPETGLIYRVHQIEEFIKYLEKNIEKIAYSADLSSFIGTNPTIRLKRKLIIKDVLDLILLHTEYLRKQPKNRIEEYSKKYNINKDLTNLFFFELKDEIFLTSSTDTDYYKLIKYNNVMIYLLFFMILEINPGQILSLKDDRSCNFFFYDKIGKTLFSNLFLRLNQKEKVPIERIPLLCYTIYYFSCIFTNNRIWFWNENIQAKTKEETIKAKQFGRINIQKTIINTLVDLINSIMEANYEVLPAENTNQIGQLKEKNYLYESPSAVAGHLASSMIVHPNIHPSVHALYAFIRIIICRRTGHMMYRTVHADRCVHLWLPS